MGSAVAFHLAQRGRRLLGIDRFHPPHHLGSSHGLSRIIREAYFEHPAYVPLVQRAYQLWRELELKSNRKLLLQTGGLMIGQPDGVLVAGALKSARQHDLPYELLSTAQLRRRLPAFRPDHDMVAVAEPRAGVLFPEVAIETHLQLARERGAALRFEERVTGWQTDGNEVAVETANHRYVADWLVLSAGPWLTALLNDFRLPLVVERQVLLWFEPRARPDQFKPGQFPIFICQYSALGLFYGFPDLGDGVKAALHHEGRATHPDAPPADITTADIQPVRQLLEHYIPDAAGSLKLAKACLYTNAPDEHFLFGCHPAHPRVIIVSPCSGHGFKFSPVIGEMVAATIDGQSIPFDLGLFSPARFAKQGDESRS